MATLEEDWEEYRKLIVQSFAIAGYSIDDEIAKLKPKGAFSDHEMYHDQQKFGQQYPTAELREECMEDIRAGIAIANQTLGDMRRLCENPPPLKKPKPKKQKPWEKDPDAWKRGG